MPISSAALEAPHVHHHPIQPRPQPSFSERQAREIEAELKRSIQGEVRFDDGNRALYSTDSSNYRQYPIGVVIPRNADDVVETIAIARRYGAPITGRGGGTSLAGQCCNTAIIIDFSKYMNQILEIDTQRKTARVQPGLILDHLNEAVKPRGLLFAPDPSTHNHCTIGGMIGNNSCGVHSVMSQFYGPGARTSDNLLEMEILTYDGLRIRVGATDNREIQQIISKGGRRGEIYESMLALRDKYADLIRARYPKIPRRVSGYNLDDLLPEKGFNVARALAGSESTLVTVLEATLQLIDNFPCRTLVVLGYPDIYSAGDHIPDVLQFKPIGLEGIDDILVKDMKVKGLHVPELHTLPAGGGWLIAEFGGQTKQEADERAVAFMHAMQKAKKTPTLKLLEDPAEEKALWEVRDSGLGASARVPGQPDTWEGWEDSAVPPDKLGAYLGDFRALLQKYGYLCTFYGHFGQGLLHTRIDFGLKTREGVEAYERFGYDAAELVVRYGGSLSGEHGDGQSRGELLSIMFGTELVGAFDEFKSIWDPDWQMNPGKVVRPFRRDQNLRYGDTYNPPQPVTQFAYPKDHGSFSYALERCVGVGKCRRTDHETMCPSFMVTREEMHSTRGRARLLFEMLEGNVIGKNGWREESVKEALDLCLACKGCKHDCPVNVDMATYKAEFLYHYYHGRIRPRSAYSMGLIHIWARLANYAPWLVNFFTQTAPFSNVAKFIGGIAQERKMPTFANESFQDWFAERRVAQRGRQRVILWPDTFNNYLITRTAKAAVNVLEAAGFDVVVPQAKLCCGRPLYDFGMLPAAKRLLENILDTLAPEIEAGTPVVGLEPSCVAVFRDELVGLFPNHENAQRLSKSVFTISEFLDKHAPEFAIPKLYRNAIVHGHCHHKAVIGMKSEESVLAKMGLQHKILDSGCCGMAGSFGFESEHYDISEACGERVLLPAVREATKDSLIVADGFSCREQIQQLTKRQALHTAEVMDMALRLGSRGPAGNEPEKEQIAAYPDAKPNATRPLVVLGVLALVLGIAGVAKSRRK